MVASFCYLGDMLSAAGHFSKYLLFGIFDPPCIYHTGFLKLSTVDEFTISSVKSFHLFTTLTQNEFILKDLRALVFFFQFLVVTACL